MKRTIAFVLLVSIIAALFLLSGCGAVSNEYSSIVVIEKSDEAKEFEKNVLTKDGGDKVFITEDYFDILLAGFYANPRYEQSFPECDVKNKLDNFDFDGSKVYTLTPDNCENIILYIHGGGWILEFASDHAELCDILATRLNAKVYMPLYPLAPEYTSTDTYAMIENLYKELLKEGKDIYIMGDSAGANIALGLMYTIKEEGLQKPDKVVLLSPCADMSFSNEKMKEIEKTDPVLAIYGCLEGAKLWAGEENLKNPKNSAIYADVSGYPDTMIIHGTNDILYPDSVTLYENMKKAGVNVTFVKGEDLWHVFTTEPLPERDESVDLIEKFCAG